MTTLRNLIIALALVPATALAQDAPPFTITVPLELNSLPPEVTHYKVSCSVSPPPGGRIIARGDASGTISGGNFRGDVVVRLALQGGFADPSLASEYRCSLHLSDGRSIGGLVYMDDANTRFPLASGAPYRRSLGGPLPR